MPDMTAREARRQLGMVIPLDQFLETYHDLPEREAMAKELKTSLPRLEVLMSLAKASADPQTVLISRANLNLTMSGAGPRVR